MLRLEQGLSIICPILQIHTCGETTGLQGLSYTVFSGFWGLSENFPLPKVDEKSWLMTRSPASYPSPWAPVHCVSPQLYFPFIYFVFISVQRSIDASLPPLSSHLRVKESLLVNNYECEDTLGCTVQPLKDCREVEEAFWGVFQLKCGDWWQQSPNGTV